MVQPLAAEFVLLELQKLLLFGFDMPLKIQDALVNAFVVLNSIYILLGLFLFQIDLRWKD